MSVSNTISISKTPQVLEDSDDEEAADLEIQVRLTGPFFTRLL